MGGTPCVIIIIGNELGGMVNGIADLYAASYEAQPALNEQEKRKLRDFLVSLKSGTSNLVNTIRQGSDIDIDISTLGQQVVGSLNAICRSADSDDVDADVKADVLAFIDVQRTEAQKWLTFLRERATKGKV